MKRALAIAVVSSLPHVAWACESVRQCPEQHAAVEAQPARVSTAPALIGEHCSYSTSAVIKRVLERGEVFEVEAILRRAAEGGVGAIAAPYVLGSPDARVLANAVLEDAVASGAPPAPVRLKGRRLEHRGVVWVVLESAVPTSG